MNSNLKDFLLIFLIYRVGYRAEKGYTLIQNRPSLYWVISYKIIFFWVKKSCTLNTFSNENYLHSDNSMSCFIYCTQCLSTVKRNIKWIQPSQFNNISTLKVYIKNFHLLIIRVNIVNLYYYWFPLYKY